MDPTMSSNSLVLVDGHAIVYRAYHAFPPLTTPDGELVNAVYGFSRIVLKFLKDLKPTHIAVAFDMPKPTFRHTQFAGYKAQRKETPTELIAQLGRVREVVDALGIPTFGVEGYEADDVIGTIAWRLASSAHGPKVVIATGDKDAFQLVVDEKVTVYTPPTQYESAKEYDEKMVEEKMGIPPSLIVDYKGLAGDPSDNIPGVRGVGAKTAVTLLKLFGSIDGLYKALSSPDSLSPEQRAVLKPKLLSNLAEGQDSALMSRELARIDCNVPLSFTLDDCVVTKYDKAKTVTLFETLGFHSLVPQLPNDDYESSIQDALF